MTLKLCIDLTSCLCMIHSFMHHQKDFEICFAVLEVFICNNCVKCSIRRILKSGLLYLKILYYCVNVLTALCNRKKNVRKLLKMTNPGYDSFIYFKLGKLFSNCFSYLLEICFDFNKECVWIDLHRRGVFQNLLKEWSLNFGWLNKILVAFLVTDSYHISKTCDVTSTFRDPISNCGAVTKWRQHDHESIHKFTIQL